MEYGKKLIIVLVGAVLVGLSIAWFFNSPSPEPINGTPPDEAWCWDKYMHRNYVETINLFDDETGTQEQISLAEAKSRGLVDEGSMIYMDNFQEYGVLCGSYLYHGKRDAYKFCDSNLLTEEERGLCDTMDLNEILDFIGQKKKEFDFLANICDTNTDCEKVNWVVMGSNCSSGCYNSKYTILPCDEKEIRRTDIVPDSVVCYCDENKQCNWFEGD